MDINLLDIGFIFVIVLFMIRGLLTGLIREVMSLVGIFLGFILASKFYADLSPQLMKVLHDETWASVASYVIIFIMVFILVIAIGAMLRKLFTKAIPGWLDYVLGFILGFLKGMVVCAIIVILLKALLPDSGFLEKSVGVPYLTWFIDFVEPFLPVGVEV